MSGGFFRSDLISDKTRHKEHCERKELSTTSVKGMESHDDVAIAKGKKVARAYDTKDDYRSPEKEGLHKLSRKSKENGTFEQKRIEIELREKALESLRAKKGIGN